MDLLLWFTLTTVAVVVVFDFTNGFHDASNIVATIVASRAMRPAHAIALVATFEFLGPILGGTAVANTIGSFVRVEDLAAFLSVEVTLYGIVGAIIWNLVTWRYGLPSSSSHALVGGLVGAVLVSAGPEHVVWGISDLMSGRVHGVTKIILALLVSPVIGFLIGFGLHRFMRFFLRGCRPSINRYLRRIQVITAAALAFAHGANDAQKSMGVITMVLVSAGFLPRFDVPMWVILLCAGSLTAGILSGGWRIVRTVGFGIYRVRPLHAVDAQLTSGVVVMASALGGAPVSTTHVVSSSIMGIGASEHPRAVRWTKGKEIVAAWVLTLPVTALIAMLLYLVGSPLVEIVFDNAG